MSTSNIQNYLSNVFRPAYKFNATTGQFEAVINMFNVNDLNVASFTAAQFNVGDVNGNAYVGSNAGNPSTTLNNAYRNVAVGVTAGSNISNVDDSIFIGFGSGVATQNASSVIAIGKGALTGGSSTIYIGTGTGTTSGSNNIFIGHGISSIANIDNQLRIGVGAGGQTIYNADLALNRVGILTSNPQYEIDLDGYTYIRDSLGVTGSLNVSGNTILNNLTVAGTTSFSNLATSGTLNVSGISTLYNTLNVFSNGVNVSGISLFNSNVGVKGTLNVSGASLFTSNVGVTGTFNASGASLFTSNLGVQGILNVSGDAALYSNLRMGPINNASAALHISRNVNFNPTNVPGILLDNAHIVMAQSSNGNQRLAMGYNGSNSTGFIQAYTSGSNINNFLINPNGGNLGINTTTPVFTLDVGGDGRFTGNLGVSGTLNVSGASLFTSNLGVRGTLNVSGQTFFGSNVGIGTAAPAFPLDVTGTIRGSSNIVAITASSALTTTAWTTISNASISGYNVLAINYTPKQTTTGRIQLVVQARLESQWASGSSNDNMAYDLVRNWGLSDQNVVGSYRYPIFDNTVVAAGRAQGELMFQHPFGLIDVSSGISTQLSIRLVKFQPNNTGSDDPMQIRKAHLSIMELSLV